MKPNGFTLIELLIAVALIIIVTGVTGDIVISLVRGYNKTQVTNEIEQNANFIMVKIEKELRNATAVTNPATAGSQVKKIVFSVEVEGLPVQVTYELKTDATGVGAVFRQEGDDADLQLSNNDAVSGVDISVANSYFILVSKNPDVVQIHLEFSQVGSPVQSFVGNLKLDTTVVVRGTY
ncbi:MAG: hypothetical protein UX79_C0010G0016 [candidate division WWE3 bacterium GW2011_GWB1_47_11]|uniref:Prepilin-type N-terminal cleavage/methylation domain-containing protein n=2 Tax=Katanobacteria TaxID=422282 RepID=A0A0G1RJK2_UNCKA|nr:MAG: hypothetical protein UX73_C0007G0016 [candidate division WWE3 bacterium GW2011_GWC1_47_10]KKU57509.1 MAG: hypothetical protein UX79_C0010G0016 [candidate division WWE3 bacterium GW2011_GWB1_47_11]